MEKCKIIIDTNLWISFLIGKRLSVLKSLVSNTKLAIYVCDNLIDEIKRVSLKTKIQKYILENDNVLLLEMIDMYCTHVVLNKTAISNLRDINDIFLLSLAETVNADFIITGDKDLLELGVHNKTRIVSVTVFISEILPLKN